MIVLWIHLIKDYEYTIVLMMSLKLTWCVKMKPLKTVNKKRYYESSIDNKLNFATHLSNITKNATIKFNALTRVQKYMTTYQKR